MIQIIPGESLMFFQGKCSSLASVPSMGFRPWLFCIQRYAWDRRRRLPPPPPAMPPTTCRLVQDVKAKVWSSRTTKRIGVSLGIIFYLQAVQGSDQVLQRFPDSIKAASAELKKVSALIPIGQKDAGNTVLR